MKTIVVYHSKTGFTERYARWLAEAFPCDIRPLRGLNADALQGYDTIVFGGRVQAGKIGGLKKLRALLPASADKRLILFATGAAPAQTQASLALWPANLTAQEQQTIPCFYLQSGINYEKMGWAERLLMRLFARMLRAKKDKTPEEAESARVISASFDASARAYLTPLLHCLQARAEQK